MAIEKKCPVCGHSTKNDFCEQCGFELHICPTPNPELEAYERERVAKYKAMRDALLRQQEQTVKEGERRLEELTKKKNDLENQKTGLEKDKSALAKQVQTLTATIEGMKAEIQQKATLPAMDVAGYLVQLQAQEIIGVYPIQTGKTVVGKKPQGNGQVHICKIIDSEPQFQSEHFSIETTKDGMPNATLLTGEWSVDYHGNRPNRQELANGTRIFIGSLELIFIC